AVDPLRSEKRDYYFAICYWCRIGVGRLDVPLLLGYALVRDPIPDHGAGPQIETIKLPLLGAAIVRRVAFAEESALETRVGLAADGGGDEDAVAPHDRARVRETRNRGFPRDIASLRDIPGHRQLLLVRCTRRVGSAERGPVLREAARRQ